MNKTQVNWNKVRHFIPSEFPVDPKYAEPQLIYNLDTFRRLVSQRTYPSPIERAFVRFRETDSNNYHYCAPDLSIRSRAVDVFVEGVPFKNWINAISCGLWGGVGVYFGTFYGHRSYYWPMLHLDIRPRKENEPPFMWYRDPDGNYVYFMFRESSIMERLSSLFNAYGIGHKKQSHN